jgi:hypothetical protein
MTVQTLKIGAREFVVVAKRDFDKLAAQARRQEAEDRCWTKTALEAEAKSRAKGERPIAFEDVERELEARKRQSASKRRVRRVRP